MRTIKAIVRGGLLDPLEPLDLPEETTVTLTLAEGDDVPACAIAQVAGTGGAFGFLSDPREDIYSLEDGEAL
jgi:hypothetical protein